MASTHSTIYIQSVLIALFGVTLFIVLYSIAPDVTCRKEKPSS